MGVITCAYIDIGYELLPDLETTHIYIVPQERSFLAAVRLFKFVEDYARERGIIVLFHQCNYLAAVAGQESNSQRVEKLYRARGYSGPVSTVYNSASFVRAGVTYLFNGAIADKAGIAKVPNVCRPDGGPK